ncbi:uncharacterized protein LOC143587959 [Bidens hawaiensis]|uniref:uncharacterized protein LOC143587959 n=1 Tax=Bidens hawaiensis TaxID=980011 RepID=UPI00404B9489
MYDIQRIYKVHSERVAGSNNDLNVIDQSPIFDDLIDGVEPPQAFFANGEHFKYGYYLVDGIYSEWGTLVQAYASPLSDKQKYFTKRQELARKDIERAFGVLKKKWAILANPIKFWTGKKITEVVYTCVILHNMILEDEGHAIC